MTSALIPNSKFFFHPTNLKIHQEEEKQRQEQIKLELSRIMVRQKELEENNERFMKNEREIKKELRNIDVSGWTNEEYEFMARRDEDLLSIKDFATVCDLIDFILKKSVAITSVSVI